jgi:hypothetical protein
MTKEQCEKRAKWLITEYNNLTSKRESRLREVVREMAILLKEIEENPELRGV